LKSILKILFYFVFSKYFLVVFCTSLANMLSILTHVSPLTDWRQHFCRPQPREPQNNASVSWNVLRPTCARAHNKNTTGLTMWDYSAARELWRCGNKHGSRRSDAKLLHTHTHTHIGLHTDVHVHSRSILYPTSPTGRGGIITDVGGDVIRVNRRGSMKDVIHSRRLIATQQYNKQRHVIIIIIIITDLLQHCSTEGHNPLQGQGENEQGNGDARGGER